MIDSFSSFLESKTSTFKKPLIFFDVHLRFCSHFSTKTYVQFAYIIINAEYALALDLRQIHLSHHTEKEHANLEKKLYRGEVEKMKQEKKLALPKL